MRTIPRKYPHRRINGNSRLACHYCGALWYTFDLFEVDGFRSCRVCHKPGDRGVNELADAGAGRKTAGGYLESGNNKKDLGDF